jgi:N-acylneuraminate cytidylyltransferase
MRQNITPQYSENGSFYIFKPDILKKNKNRFGGKIGIYEMDAWKIYEIDEADDIEICNYFMTTKILKNN